MNNLSWFIYLTQVADSVQFAAGAIVFIGVLVGLFGAIFMPMMWSEFDLGIKPRAIIRPYVIVMALAICIGTFTPSRQTLLLIAGSEMGERAINSAAVQDVVNPGMDLVKLWIKQETDKLTKKAE